LTQRLQDFGGGDYLSGVALGVVGYVDERASDGGGQLLPADDARDIKVGGRQDANAVGGIAEGDFDFGQESGQSFNFSIFGAALLCFEGGKLLGGELVPFRITQQTIGGASDVTEMESYRR